MNDVNRFIRSRFSADEADEKRNIFFHQNIWRCHTCHKPIVKARIDTNNFSNYHQNLICTCRRKKNAPNVVAPAAHGVNIVSPAAHGGVGPVNRAEI